MRLAAVDTPPVVPVLTDTQRDALTHLAKRRHSWPALRSAIYEDSARYTEPVLHKLADLGLARYVEYPPGAGVLPHYEATFEVAQCDQNDSDWTVDLPASAASNQIAAAVVRGHLHRVRGQSFYQPPRLTVVGAERTEDGSTRFTVRMGAGERWTHAGLQPYTPHMKRA